MLHHIVWDFLEWKVNLGSPVPTGCRHSCISTMWQALLPVAGSLTRFGARFGDVIIMCCSQFWHVHDEFWHVHDEWKAKDLQYRDLSVSVAFILWIYAFCTSPTAAWIFPHQSSDHQLSGSSFDVRQQNTAHLPRWPLPHKHSANREKAAGSLQAILMISHLSSDCLV